MIERKTLQFLQIQFWRLIYAISSTPESLRFMEWTKLSWGADKVCITCTTIISANRMAKLLGKTLYKTKIQGSVIFIEEES